MEKFIFIVFFMNKKIIQIQWTCANVEEARRIGEALVQNQDVACVNIIPQIESIFKWNGKVDHAQEVKVLLKTSEEKFSHVMEYILSHCSYEVPEISKIIIDEENPAYLQWVFDTITNK